jgi:hypothetical protein
MTCATVNETDGIDWYRTASETEKETATAREEKYPVDFPVLHILDLLVQDLVDAADAVEVVRLVDVPTVGVLLLPLVLGPLLTEAGRLLLCHRGGLVTTLGCRHLPMNLRIDHEDETEKKMDLIAQVLVAKHVMGLAIDAEGDVVLTDLVPALRRQLVILVLPVIPQVAHSEAGIAQSGSRLDLLNLLFHLFFRWQWVIPGISCLSCVRLGLAPIHMVQDRAWCRSPFLHSKCIRLD